MQNITSRLDPNGIENREEHIIQRNYYTLKSLFPIDDSYLFISDLSKDSLIDQMIHRYFNKKTGDETVLCTTVKQLDKRILHNDFPPLLTYVFVVDGTVKQKGLLNEKVPNLVIYEGWADFEGFPIISLNTNNWEGRGLDGKAIIQEGKKEDSLGRVLAGVAVKLISDGNEVTEANQPGQVFVKYLPSIDWVNTNKVGEIDEGGFLYIHNVIE